MNIDNAEITVVLNNYKKGSHLKKHTCVPPHPKNDMSMWGSLPETDWSIGQDSSAISMNH